MTIWLYVKTHNVTGLKYFGKTTKEPFKYYGSGVYWRNHLKAHGYNIRTDIVGCFEDEESCTEVALKFSIDNNIVESSEWANLRLENGLDGAPVGHDGHNFTENQLIKISDTSKERWTDPDYREKVIRSQKEAWTDERRDKNSQMMSEKWTDERKAEHSKKIKSLFEDEQRRKDVSKFMKEMIRTESHKANISIALKGKPKSAEHKEKLRQAALNRKKAD